MQQGRSTMPARLLVATVIALTLTTPALTAVMPSPSAGATEPGHRPLAMVESIEPAAPEPTAPGIADAARAAPLPAGIALVGAALLGFGLLRRRRG
jgi:hypothetical protein